MLNFIVAHSGEIHETAAEATAHALAWYIQLPLFLLLSVGFASTIYFITKKKDTAILLTAFVMLIAGFTMFEIAPIVSVTSITIGLVSTLFITLAGLAGQKK